MEQKQVLNGNDIDKLWESYKKTGSVEERNRIIMHYVSLVKNIAWHIHDTLPDYVDVEELYSAGLIGLIDAVEKYDPGQNVKFTTYARYRIRGAIYDELRRMDWASRSMRKKVQELEQVITKLEQEKGESVSDEEIARAMNISVEELNRMLGEIKGLSILSLDGFKEGDENYPIDIKDESVYANPEKQFEEKRLKEIVVEAIESLPERERLILTLYYYEEMTFKEIGLTLGVSESRISQLHSKAIIRLRGRIKQKLGMEV